MKARGLLPVEQLQRTLAVGDEALEAHAQEPRDRVVLLRHCLPGSHPRIPNAWLTVALGSRNKPANDCARYSFGQAKRRSASEKRTQEIWVP